MTSDAQVCLFLMRKITAIVLQLDLLEKGQDMYARAYDIQAAKLGSEHPDVAATMNNTAGLLKAMGKLADAEAVYRAVSYLGLREPYLPQLLIHYCILWEHETSMEFLLLQA